MLSSHSVAQLTQIDWRSLANKPSIRALLEDLIGFYKLPGLDGSQLALAVWFEVSPQAQEHKVLLIFAGPSVGTIAGPQRQSLVWKTGQDQPPFAQMFWTSADDFARLMASNPESLSKYREGPEIVYFNGRVPIPKTILDFFGFTAEPSGLIRVWRVRQGEYHKDDTAQALLGRVGGRRQELGIVKTEESPDFENCRALVHVLVNVEIGQRWLPSSPAGVQQYGFYDDWLAGKPSYFLAEGGAFYQITKFEVIHAPQYADLVLERLRDDRYPEVYLRTVHLPEPPAA